MPVLQMPQKYIIYPHSDGPPVLIPTTTALTVISAPLPFEPTRVTQREHSCAEPELFWDSPIAGGGMNGFAVSACLTPDNTPDNT